MEVIGTVSGRLPHITLPQACVIAIGFLYVSGYYINSMFLINYGLFEPELFKLAYIKIGFVFSIITFGLSCIPFGAFYLTYRVRKFSKMPYYHIGAIGTAFHVIVFLGFPLFLAFFATDYDWNLQLKPILGMTTFRSVTVALLLLSSFFVVLLPCLERVICSYVQKKNKTIIRMVPIEVIRYAGLVLVVLLLSECLTALPWLRLLLSHGWYYVAVSLVTIVGGVSAFYWIDVIKNAKGSIVVFPLIFFGIASLYYMSIASYVYGVYRYIPANRGGKLPIAEAFFSQAEGIELIKTHSDQGDLLGPFYIIEENDGYLYVVKEDMDKWFINYLPVHVFDKSTVPHIILERINDGFPRYSR